MCTNLSGAGVGVLCFGVRGGGGGGVFGGGSGVGVRIGDAGSLLGS